MAGALRTMLAASALGAAAAFGASAPAFAASSEPDALTRTDQAPESAPESAGVPVLGHSVAQASSTVQHAVDPAANLSLNPLQGGGINPVSNSVGTQVADFRPVTTGMLTGGLAHGASLSDLVEHGPQGS